MLWHRLANADFPCSPPDDSTRINVRSSLCEYANLKRSHRVPYLYAKITKFLRKSFMLPKCFDIDVKCSTIPKVLDLDCKLDMNTISRRLHRNAWRISRSVHLEHTCQNEMKFMSRLYQWDLKICTCIWSDLKFLSRLIPCQNPYFGGDTRVGMHVPLSHIWTRIPIHLVACKMPEASQPRNKPFHPKSPLNLGLVWSWRVALPCSPEPTNDTIMISLADIQVILRLPTMIRIFEREDRLRPVESGRSRSWSQSHICLLKADWFETITQINICSKFSLKVPTLQGAYISLQDYNFSIKWQDMSIYDTCWVTVVYVLHTLYVIWCDYFVKAWNFHLYFLYSLVHTL